jgi:hypothetical protein
LGFLPQTHQCRYRNYTLARERRRYVKQSKTYAALAVDGSAPGMAFDK